MASPKVGPGERHGEPADAASRCRDRLHRARRHLRAARAVLRALPDGTDEARPHLLEAAVGIVAVERELDDDPTDPPTDALRAEALLAEDDPGTPLPVDPANDPGLAALHRIDHRLTRVDERVRARFGPDPRDAFGRRVRRVLIPVAAGALAVLAWRAAVPDRTPWRGAYFPTADLQGDPALRDEASIRFDWHGHGPLYPIPADEFSARWDTCLVLETPLAANFDLASDDGARLYANGELLADDWRADGPHRSRGVLRLPVGTHHLQVTYFERTGAASIELELTDAQGDPIDDALLHHPDAPDAPPGCAAVSQRFRAATDPKWIARYYPDLGFQGEPLTRPVHAIRFDWAGDAAIEHELPSDQFSARFDTCLEVSHDDLIELTLRSDDGSRVLVDGEVVVDNWNSAGDQVARGTIRLGTGRHHLRVEYFDEVGHAAVSLDARWSSGAQIQADALRVPQLDPTDPSADPCPIDADAAPQ